MSQSPRLRRKGPKPVLRRRKLKTISASSGVREPSDGLPYSPAQQKPSPPALPSSPYPPQPANEDRKEGALQPAINPPEAPNPDGDTIHTSAVYFIDARGAERYLATPMVDHASNGTAYLPPAQIAAWAGGIARLAGDLAR